jgi:hypothetical protein
MQGKSYRGHVELTNGTVIDLVNNEQGIVKDTVQSILKGGCRFDVAGSQEEPALLIYHPSFDVGKTVLGWIAPGVTEPMTNEAFLAQRHLQRQAA